MVLKAPSESHQCKKATAAEKTLAISQSAHLHGAGTVLLRKYIKDRRTLLKPSSSTLTQRLAGPREERFLQAHPRYPDPSGVLQPPSLTTWPGSAEPSGLCFLGKTTTQKELKSGAGRCLLAATPAWQPHLARPRHRPVWQRGGRATPPQRGAGLRGTSGPGAGSHGDLSNAAAAAPAWVWVWVSLPVPIPAPVPVPIPVPAAARSRPAPPTLQGARHCGCTA